MVSPMNSSRSGCAGAGGKEVDDSAANAELAGLVDRILARVAGGSQQVAEVDGGDVLARRHVSDTDASRSGGLSLRQQRRRRRRRSGGQSGQARPARAARARAPRRCRSAARARGTDRPRATGTAGRRARPRRRKGLRARRRRTGRPRSSARRRRRSARRAAVRPRAAEAAANMAFAAGVRPVTRAAGAPAPSRPAAVFSSARSVRELEVYVDMGAIPAGAGTHHYSRCLLRLPAGFRPVGPVGSILTRTRAALLLKGRVTFLTVVGRIPRKSG